MYKIVTVLIMICFLFINCEKKIKQDKQIELTDTIEKKKLTWKEMPRFERDGIFEIMEGRTEENQKKLKRIYFLTTEEYGYDEKEFFEEGYNIDEKNFMNDLFYLGLKSQGFQFPSEEVFAKRVKELFDIDVYADHTLNPRIVKKDNFLILNQKLYTPQIYKKVPLLYFNYNSFIFDLERRYFFYFSIYYVDEHEDDYGQKYYTYSVGSYGLSYNNYIFYNSQASLNKVYESLPERFIKGAGYEEFPKDIFIDIQKKALKEFRSKTHRWDYRMYDRSFFARDFNGNLKPRIKMLETMVELAAEDSEYARVVYYYYSRQICGVYTPDEYAANLNDEIDYGKNPEPYYTKEERAKIWAYLAYYEAELLDKYQSNLNGWHPAGFCDSFQYSTGYFYQIAKENDFYGLDFSNVMKYFEGINGWNWEEIITSWEIREPEEV